MCILTGFIIGTKVVVNLVMSNYFLIFFKIIIIDLTYRVRWRVVNDPGAVDESGWTHGMLLETWGYFLDTDLGIGSTEGRGFNYTHAIITDLIQSDLYINIFCHLPLI